MRVWKSDPSRKIGPKGIREERSVRLRKKLIEKHKHNRQIKQLQRPHVPGYIYNARRKHQIMKESRHVKDQNMEVNNPQDKIFDMPEKKKKVVKKIE